MSTLYNVLSFNGNAYVEIGDPFEDPAAFTISLWVRPAVINDGKYHGFIGRQEQGQEQGFAYRKPGLWLRPDHSGLHYDSYTTDGKRYDAILGNFFELDQWVHVAWVKRGTKYEFYKNGEPVGTGDAPAAVSRNPSLNYWLGKVDNFWIGELAEVRFWMVARSQAEIAQDMYHRLTGKEPGLSRYFPADEGEGSSVRDLTGKSAGTIHGATWKRSDLPVAPTNVGVSVGIVSINPDGDPYIELAVVGGAYDLSDHWVVAVSADKKFTFPKGTKIVPGKNVRVYTNKKGVEQGSYSFGSETAIWKSKNDQAELHSPRQFLFKFPS